MKKFKKLLLLTSLIFLMGCKEETVSRSAYDSMYSHICDMWTRSLEGSDYSVAFFGDSRVAGGKFEEKFSQYNSINLGIGGDKVINCINRFKMIETTKPEIVFLSIGGNDANSTSFDKSVFTSQYNELLNKLKTLDTKVILHTIPGLTAVGSLDQKTVNRCNSSIATANEVMHELATQGDYDLIDLASLMNESDGSLKKEYTSDGCHFNEECYEIWFNEVQIILNKYQTLL